MINKCLNAVRFSKQWRIDEDYRPQYLFIYTSSLVGTLTNQILRSPILPLECPQFVCTDQENVIKMLFFFPKIMVYIIKRVNNLVSNVKSISCLDFLKFIPLVWRVQVLTRCLLSGYAQAWVYKILKKHIPFSVD